MPLFDKAVVGGLPVVLAGYNQDRAQLLMADFGCHIVRVALQPTGARFLTHDCAATRGTSGAPVLAKEADGWAVVGINIAAGSSANLALSPPFRD